MAAILAEAVTGDTAVSLNLILAVGGLVIGGGVGAIVSRVQQAAAIKEIKRDLEEFNKWRAKAQSQLHGQDRELLVIRERMSPGQGSKPWAKASE